MSLDPVFFYRTAHPFSNFHPSVFTEGGVTYHCAEQYLMARTPGECKALGPPCDP
ncbi:hypothetical protein [Deinococcus sp. ME38]|uniref:hypothetical protein n=1 Tax=Deinococcus sp. ME38 TaxID=3400344 RepID=UPI003B58C015